MSGPSQNPWFPAVELLLGLFFLLLLLGTGWAVTTLYPFGLSTRRPKRWVRFSCLGAALLLWLFSLKLVMDVFDREGWGVFHSWGMVHGAVFFLVPAYHVWVLVLLVVTSSLAVFAEPVSQV